MKVSNMLSREVGAKTNRCVSALGGPHRSQSCVDALVAMRKLSCIKIFLLEFVDTQANNVLGTFFLGMLEFEGFQVFAHYALVDNLR